ncbi:MAG TPA: hypothetical protein VLH16_03285, partial [Bacteroidales bacterium]|nr:hypothetical protein [Bacteroidales bacterium]
MMKAIFIFLIILPLFVSLLGCRPARQVSTNQSISQPAKGKERTPRSEEVSALFIEANKEKLLGNINIALQMFQKCFELDP